MSDERRRASDEMHPAQERLREFLLERKPKDSEKYAKWEYLRWEDIAILEIRRLEALLSEARERQKRRRRLLDEIGIELDSMSAQIESERKGETHD